MSRSCYGLGSGNFRQAETIMRACRPSRFYSSSRRHRSQRAPLFVAGGVEGKTGEAAAGRRGACARWPDFIQTSQPPRPAVERNGIFETTPIHLRHPARLRHDSPLEEERFEPSVPLGRERPERSNAAVSVSTTIAPSGGRSLAAARLCSPSLSSLRRAVRCTKHIYI